MKLLGAKEFLKTIKSGTLFCELWMNNEEDCLESIAVITKNKEDLKDISHKLKGKVKILTFDRNDIIYRGGKVLIPAYFAKGLEFDGVIMLEDEEETPNLVKYIMCTRALHRLSVIKQNKK